MNVKLVNVFLFLSFLLTKTYGQEIAVFSNEDRSIKIGPVCHFFEDKEGKLSLEEVIALNAFTPVKQDVPNFGVSSSTYWLEFTLRNNSPYQTLNLVVSQPVLDDITFYKDSAGVYYPSQSGEEFKFSQRELVDPSYIFRFNLDPGKRATFYIRVRSRDNIQIPLEVGSVQAVFERTKTKDTVAGIYVGIMLVMLFYNIFIYSSTRDRSYLHYVIYLLAVLFTQASIQGYTFQYLWPNVPWLAVHSSYIFPPAVGIAGMNFLRVFLHTDEHSRWYKRAFIFLSLAYLVAASIGFLGAYKLSFRMIEVCAISASVVMLYMASTMARQGYRPAKFFLVAWILFLIGVSIYVMKDFGVLPYNNFTYYMMPIGSAAEVILLSFALADRINILQKEKESSQAEALRISLENERIIREQNLILEKKVKERTVELEETNEELQATLNNLKDTQAQLVDAEKMASLGQLTAGIAHEINNPINFVSGNIEPLKLDVQDVLSLIDRYGEITPETDLALKLAEIEAYKKQIDLDYVKQEINSLLTGIGDGARRTAEIVKGLRTFSRLDESELKEVDINEGLESTLVLLRNSIPEEVNVQVDYGDIPRVECFSGKINQVFMNIVNNGIQAIKGKKIMQNEQLLIRTYPDGDYVKISIKDSGIGMTPEVKGRIFEPFFTTKDVGEGTGLGLSIVFKIIEKHSGKIVVNTASGKGTEFIISLPVKARIVEDAS